MQRPTYTTLFIGGHIIPGKAWEKIEECLNTNYLAEGIAGRERAIQHLFATLLPGVPYSRELVSEAHYQEYKGRGGWRDKESFTQYDWVPSPA